jgi:hypothetical protein
MPHMARSYSLEGTGVDRQQVRTIAVLAACDERSVITEILAQLGKGTPVRGMVGERVRNALKAARIPPLQVLPDAAPKKVSGRQAGRAQ